MRKRNWIMEALQPDRGITSSHRQKLKPDLSRLAIRYMFLMVKIIDWLQRGSPILFFVIKIGRGVLISSEASAIPEDLIQGSAVGHKQSL